MSKPSAPCHFCDHREMDCHTKCEPYKKYCDELAKLNTLINNAKETEAQFIQSKRSVRRKK